MLGRLRDIAAGGGRLFRAEAELVLVKFRRSLGWGLALAAGGTLLLFGVITMLVAAGALIARELGWVWAVGIIGLGVAVVGLVVLLAAKAAMASAMKREHLPAEDRARAADATHQIKGEDRPGTPKHLDPDRNTPHPSETATGAPHMHDSEYHDPSRQHRSYGVANGGGGNIKDRAAEFISQHPGVAASGAFALLSFLGPLRALKLASRGMMVASVASKASRFIGEQRNAHSDETRPTHESTAAPSPHPRHRPSADTTDPEGVNDSGATYTSPRYTAATNGKR